MFQNSNFQRKSKKLKFQSKKLKRKELSKVYSLKQKPSQINEISYDSIVNLASLLNLI